MDFLKKYKKAFILTVSFLCIVLILTTISFRQKPTFAENTMGFFITPVDRFLTLFSSYFQGKVDFLININKIENDNSTLTKKVEALEAELARANLIEEENKRLSKLLELNQKYPDYPKTGAYIIAKDPGNWYDIFLIDKGTDASIQKNMVVITNGGLVGRIIESGTNYSKVISIIDDTSTVSAQSARTGDIGLVKGDMKLMQDGLCRMEYIDANAEIVEGDEIVTSHLSKIFPPGLVIGYVREIKTDINGLNKFALIEPAVNFKNIDTILVINKLFDKKIENFEGLEE